MAGKRTGTTPTSLTWRAAIASRLRAHSLVERAPRDALEDVIGAVCGVHAQVMTAAELSIGTRVSMTRSEIRAALWNERRLVKTHGIRGTIHVFPSREFPMWRAALGARADPGEAKRLEALGLDRRQIDQIVDAIGEALDGRRLTLRALGEEVGARVGAWALEGDISAFGGSWPKWRVGLGFAGVAGIVCFGPNQGTEVTYVRPDQWLGPWTPAEPEAALAEVFRRYLRAYGPATYRDFAQWFRLRPPVAREIADAMRDELEEVDVEGYRCLRLRSDGADPPVAGSVRLLPHFDCYLRGSFPREQVAPDRPEKAAGGTGNVPTLIVDGVVAGVWEQRRTGKRLEVRVEPFEKPTRARRAALESEVRRIGEILETEATLTLGEVSARAHL